MMFSIFRIHLYCVPAFSACISIASGGNGIPYFNLSTSQPLNLSTSQPVWRRLNLSTCISTVFQHCVRAFLLHFYRAPALFSVRIPTVFQHWVRAFLLICSTLCMHFFACLLHVDWFGLLCLCAHFYCVPALSACISIALQHSLHAFLLYPSTVFQHCMRAFLLYSSTFLVAFTHVCMCLYVFVPYTIYHIRYASISEETRKWTCSFLHFTADSD